MSQGEQFYAVVVVTYLDSDPDRKVFEEEARAFAFIRDIERRCEHDLADHGGDFIETVDIWKVRARSVREAAEKADRAEGELRWCGGKGGRTLHWLGLLPARN